ncbi:hypothetical protein MF271_20715 (plasmid) [Deinococcus sp. KNUC1210]|uniref:alginate O-acetyltransferase AlgX-related protein n=1 Tax=Deinococcus sp. KNUC1210 TaxID=2917691 RepID=UPI001EF12398|nr:hypothetical protein [Deinococcus sp. KNUC1210]ULH17482.1 hypothetical protein MF271_20715 [Deinococcus sp. KNUC1210]
MTEMSPGSPPLPQTPLPPTPLSQTLPAQTSAPARTVLSWLPGLVFAGIVAAGGILAVTSPATRTWPHDQPVMTGQWAHAYEHTLDAEIPFRTPAVALWATVNYALFHEARDGALIGRNGWLYTAEEFQTAPGDSLERTRKLRYIRHVHDILHAQGVDLVVALLPAKSRIYADQVGSRRVPAQLVSQYSDFLRQLHQAGITAPDLLTAFQHARHTGSAALFLRTDTHWSPAGAALAAQTVAQTIRSTHTRLPPAQFATTLSRAQARSGDLLNYLPIDSHIGPSRDLTGTSSTERTDSGGGGLLLSSESLPVALVGTSYSARTKNNVWNFDGQLQQFLGSEVLNAAQEGKGPISPMAAYLTSSEWKTSPPQVVVWEIPERYLRVQYAEETTADR